MEQVILYGDRYDCCGCSACYAACPAGAVTMRHDREGFLYPVLREDACIKCGACMKACAFKADTKQKHTNCRADRYESPETYAVRHKDLTVRMASRSGGIFTALTDAVFRRGGVVYGSVLNEKLLAVHIRAEKAEDRDRMRGSKYIQSEPDGIFRQVKKDLQSGREVLFSGTSCQVAGLRRFLQKDYENLFCVDIVCHGVPSPAVWKKYLKWQEKKNGGTVISADFRNKKDYGWKDHVESLFLVDGRQIDSRVFTTMFYGHCILRPSCYRCPYKDVMHPGDITIADYWGIDRAAPGFSDNKGVSLVLVNTPEGSAAFREAEKELDFRVTDLADSMQPPLQEPFPEPPEREAFWNAFYTKPFGRLVPKYGTQPFKIRLKRKLRAVKRKVLKRK